MRQRRSKYGNRPTPMNGRVFASKKEADYYQKLKLLKAGKEIKDFKCQVRFEILPKIQHELAVHYIADFVVTERDGSKTVIDVKSKATKTQLYRLKRKLMLWRWGIKIMEV